ncbi:transposase IS4 family protein [Paenibacillus algicola]|uniref:Transposase IS4 family protein n=1 Tax=Paenibacillus algicola TaxID=2565926 RepID=A0A4P8XLH1_9BACL|nr:transposase IS4 family protein [Paenibacillus algicola]
MKTAGFKKNLFQLVFVLLFHHKNWFRLLESGMGATFPGKTPCIVS